VNANAITAKTPRRMGDTVDLMTLNYYAAYLGIYCADLPPERVGIRARPTAATAFWKIDLMWRMPWFLSSTRAQRV
jgi:hypothetical protein